MSPATAYVTLLAVNANVATWSNTWPGCRSTVSGSGAGTRARRRNRWQTLTIPSSRVDFVDTAVETEGPREELEVGGDVVHAEVRDHALVLSRQTRACAHRCPGLSRKRSEESQKPAAAIKSGSPRPGCLHGSGSRSASAPEHRSVPGRHLLAVFAWGYHYRSLQRWLVA